MPVTFAGTDAETRRLMRRARKAAGLPRSGSLTPAQQRQALHALIRLVSADLRSDAEALLRSLTTATLSDDATAVFGLRDTLAGWKAKVAGTLRKALTAAALIVGNGRDDEAVAHANEAIAVQEAFLDRFAEAIDAGARIATGQPPPVVSPPVNPQPLDGTLPARAEMYAGSLWAEAEDFRKTLASADGLTQERSILDDVAQHCGECPAEARKGWQPIGSLIPVGSRTCLSRCRCYMEYREGGEEGEGATEPAAGPEAESPEAPETPEAEQPPAKAPRKPATKPKPGKAGKGKGKTAKPATAKPEAPEATEAPKAFTDEPAAIKWASSKSWTSVKQSGPAHQALGFYKGGGFKEINGILRGSPPSDLTPERETNFRKVIKGLDAVFAKSAAPEAFTTYRGLKLDRMGLTLADLKPGSTIHDSGFVSTSLLPDAARFFTTPKGEPVMLRIAVPKGTPAVSIPRTTGDTGEVEITLNRGTSIRITGQPVQRPDGVWIVDAEVTSQ